MISGVRTCGGGAGYCLLGLDCTLDEDFLPDEGEGQHCEGLRSAFTPSAHFVCCRAANHKQPAAPVTTPLDMPQNEVVEDVLQKVAESVEAAKQRTPVPDAELRETQSEGTSTLLEQEVLESSIEGGVLQGDSDSDEEYNHEQEHEDQELYQNDAPSEAVSVLQEAKLEDSSSEEDKSTEENKISSESTEDESSSSSEETDSDEVLSTTTNKSEQKPTPSQDSPSDSETQNDLKGNVDKDSEENNTEGVVSLTNGDSQEESETFTPSPEENVTEQLMSKETISAVDKTNLDDFQRDEKTKEPITETSISEITGTPDKITTTTENPNVYKEQVGVTPQNMTLVSPELSYSKPVKIKTKPLPGKKTSNKDTSKPSSADVSLNEVVSPTVDKKSEEQSLHNEGRPGEEVVRTNSTNSDTKGGFATETSVYPEQGSVRPGSQGQASTNNINNCSREIKFEFQNRTLCFGSVYSQDWVVTSASCALRSVYWLLLLLRRPF